MEGHIRCSIPLKLLSRRTKSRGLRCSAVWEAYLAVRFLGMMEWISTRYHILSSGQKSCMHEHDFSTYSENLAEW